MHMQRFAFSFRVATVAFFFVALFASPLVSDSALAGSPGCGLNPDRPDNFNPIVKMQLKIHNLVENGQAVPAIKIGTTVVLDLTPQDSTNRGTNSKNNPTWIYEGPATPVTGKEACFQPHLKVTGAEPIRATVELDGVVATITFQAGGTPENPMGPGGGDLPTGGESGMYCGIKDSVTKTYSCIPDSREDLNCKETLQCQGKQKCERVHYSQCTNGGPAFPDDPRFPIRRTTDLGVFIADLFRWSINIVGFIVFLSFFYAGFMWLWGAAGNPAKISEAKGQMWNALFGAILLFSAYVILRTINPELVSNRGSLLPALPSAVQSQSGSSGANPLPGTNPGDPSQGLPLGTICTAQTFCGSDRVCDAGGYCIRKDGSRVDEPCDSDSDCRGEPNLFCDLTRQRSAAPGTCRRK